MKFLVCCSLAQSLANFRGKLLADIRSAGHEIVAVAPDFDGEMLQWCQERGIATESIQLESQSLNPFRDLRALAELVTIVRRHKADVVMGYTHKPALYTAYAGRIAGVPHVTMMVTGMGFGFEPGGSGVKSKLIPAITTNLFRLGCAACDKVIFHNRDNLNYFVEHHILRNQSKAVVVGGSGVDLSLFAPISFPEGLPGALTFLLVARIVRYKGIMEYAQAAHGLKLRYPDAKFLLVGYRDNNPLSYSDSEWDFINANVTYLGKTDNVRDVLAKCHVYVLPSYGEGMPRTVLEAMACGRPIITSDTYGCRDTVEQGQNGYLVPVKDSAGLHSAMQRFLDGTASYKELGRKSIELVHDRFDVDKVNKDMIHALKLDNSARPGGTPG